MQYSMEEAAILTGFLETYLNRAAVAPNIRDTCLQFTSHLHKGTLTQADYAWAEKALLFLKPFWWQEHEDHRALTNVLLRTQALAREQK